MRKRSTGKNYRSQPAKFLLKTYQMLQNPELHHVISWIDDGKAFAVKNITTLTTEVFPKYFKHCNYASFIRQLNMYDFHKRKHGQNQNVFEHELFQRGQIHLLSGIKRKICEPSQELMVVPRIRRNQSQTNRIQKKQFELEQICKKLYKQNETIMKQNQQLKSSINQIYQERNTQKMIIYLLLRNQFSQKSAPKCIFSQSVELQSAAHASNTFFNNLDEESIKKMSSIAGMFFKNLNKKKPKLGIQHSKFSSQWDDHKEESGLLSVQASPISRRQQQQSHNPLQESMQLWGNRQEQEDMQYLTL